MNNLTRGELQPAKLIRIEGNANKDVVYCMFNPHEYTLTKQNQWQDQAVRGKNTGSPNFVKGGSQSLKLTLYFDTSLQGNTDVRDTTDKLWEMMKVVPDKKKGKESDKGLPPEVAFEWGRFYFRAVLTNMSQKYTLFTNAGVPIRCQVDITLEQKIDREDRLKPGSDPVVSVEMPEQKQNVAGDRPDNIAAGGDSERAESLAPRVIAEAMRKMAEANNIDNPLNIPSGRILNK